MIRLVLLFLLFIFLSFGILAEAQDYTKLGGDMTRDWRTPAAIQVFGPKVTSEIHQTMQVDGFEPFHRTNLKKDGVGPSFVNASCGGCHVENGRGPIKFKKGGILAGGAMVVKVKEKKGESPLGIGPVLQNHNLDGSETFDLKLSWAEKAGNFPDGASFSLRKPLLSFNLNNGISYRKTAYSLRMSPPVIGVGLIEAINEQSILERSDPNDSNGDGISGRPNYGLNRRTGLNEIGRFGFKAGQPTVEQQSAAALGNEMGLSNSLFPVDEKIEFSDLELRSVTVYQKLAGVPAARDQSLTEVASGREIFFRIGCESCHRATFITGDDEFQELSGEVIHPFSDFLLHDMGKGLSDKHSEGEAIGAEWKTTPLWGLGFSKFLSKVVPRYLHDGRARTIEEAILWHDGEGKQSKDLYRALSLKDRLAMLKFLNSL